MSQINNILLSTFIRFCLIGINLIIIAIIVPLIIINPILLKECISLGNLVGIVVIGLSIGITLDGLHLNTRFKSYKKLSKDFKPTLAKILEIDEAEAIVYINKMSHVERKYGLGYIDFAHSKWVMLGTFCYLLNVVAALYLVALAIFFIFAHIPENNYNIPVFKFWMLLITALFYLILYRFIMDNVNRTQLQLQTLMGKFCKDHKDLLKLSDIEIVSLCEKKNYEIT